MLAAAAVVVLILLEDRAGQVVEGTGLDHQPLEQMGPLTLAAAAVAGHLVITAQTAAQASLSSAIPILIQRPHRPQVHRPSLFQVVIASTSGPAPVRSRSKRGAWLTLHNSTKQALLRR